MTQQFHFEACIQQKYTHMCTKRCIKMLSATHSSLKLEATQILINNRIGNTFSHNGIIYNL